MSPRAAFDASAIRGILLDIEGTTTPNAFVHDVLFPYARARMREFLRAHAAEPEIRAEIEALRCEHAADAKRAGANPSEGAAPPEWPDAAWQLPDSAAAYTHWLMDRDRKSTPLKSLQGRIWEAGYRCGELRGQVYPDVPRALARLKQQGRRIAIFSSGSVQAQKLLFGYSDAGDLTPFLDAYFDTTTGPKQDAESYRRIAVALALPPESILFISDVTAELDAARAAGMHTLLSVRSSAKPPCGAGHAAIHAFDAIPF